MKFNEIKLLNEKEILKHKELSLLTTDWTSYPELRQFLRKHKFRAMGSGAFSTVYSKLGYPTIIKVSGEEDKCWLKYASYAIEEQHDNPYVMRVKWVKKYKTRNTADTIYDDSTKPATLFVSGIEKLVPINTKIIKTVPDIVPLAWLFMDDTGTLGAFEREEYAIYDRLNKSFNFDAEHDNYDAAQNFLNQNKNHPFLKAVSEIKKLNRNCRSDLHLNNIMYRPSTNNLVITDPLAGWW